MNFLKRKSNNILENNQSVVTSLFLSLSLGLNVIVGSIMTINTANAEAVFQNPQLDTEQISAINNIIKNLPKKNFDKLNISFPLRVSKALPPIENMAEFKVRYDELLDDELLQKVANSNAYNDDDWGQVGSRGIMFNHGEIWLDLDGSSIIAINNETDIQRQRIDIQNNIDKQNLHSSLHEFEEIEVQFNTPKFIIRIDNMKDYTYRYASWSKGKSTLDKPDIVLTGEFVPEGSGGNGNYVFKNGNYIYKVYDNFLGAYGSPKHSLNVYHKDKLISSSDDLEKIEP